MADALVALDDVFNAIVHAGFLIRDLASPGYRVSQKFKAFELLLNRLNREKANWKAEIVRYGLSDDVSLIHFFQYTVSRVNRATAKLEKMDESCYGGWWPKLQMAWFPSELDFTIEIVSRTFDSLLYAYNLTKQNLNLEVRQGKHLSLRFRKDDRYIRFEETNGKVIAALRDAAGPPVVLLYGISGSGKSSLARDVALQVREAIHKRKSKVAEEAITKRESLVATASQDNCTAGTSSSTKANEHSSSDFGSLIFEEVIFLECGMKADPQTKQAELRKKLGKIALTLVGGKKEEKSNVRTLSKILLKKMSVLIILDDVWESTFLQSMIDMGHRGRNLKWLVTSQHENLCSPVNCKSVPILMKEVSVEEGRRILRAHVDRAIGDCTPLIEQYMDKIIHRVQANPLAIASIALAIDPTRFEDEKEWEAATEEVSDLLTSKVSKLIHGREYGKNCLEAIQVGFGLLTKSQQNILIVMAISKGPPIAEEIIRFVYEQSKDPCFVQSFSQVRRELQHRQFIKVVSESDNDAYRWGKVHMTWSIHILVKEFIMKKYFSSRDNQMSQIERLFTMGIKFKFEAHHDCEVVNTLAALHFDDAFCNEFAQLNTCPVTITGAEEEA